MAKNNGTKTLTGAKRGTRTARPDKAKPPNGTAKPDKAGKQKKRATVTTSDETVIRMTNVDAGESIPLNFVLTINCTNNTGTPLQVVVTCPGASATPSQGTTNQVPGTGASTDLSFDLVHTQATTGHTITAQLVDTSGGTAYAADVVDSVDVVDPNAANLTIDPNTIQTDPPDNLPVLDPNQDMIGLYDPNMGDAVTIEIEDPVTQAAATRKVAMGNRKGRRKLNFSDRATAPDVTTGPNYWRHKFIRGANKPKPGQHLRAILTDNGKVKAIVRARFV